MQDGHDEDAVIVDEDLRVDRGGRTVLAGLSLRIAAGAVAGLLRPSGCGKSTLMRAFMGVQIVAPGPVSVLGEAAGSPSLRPHVGYVTQAPSLDGDLTDLENLRFFAAVLGCENSRIRGLTRWPGC